MNKAVEFVYTHLPYDVFTDRDVALLMGPERSDYSRHGLVKRALHKGDILRIRRGIYCLAKKYQRQPLNYFSLAQLIYGPSYISLESALSYHGWIPEGVFMVTSVSLERSRTFQTPLGGFSYQRVVQEQFYEHVDRVESEGLPFFLARPFKALCDYFYVHRQNWRSVRPLQESLRIEDDMLGQITRSDLDCLYENYRSRRVKTFIMGVRKDLGL